MNIGEKKEKYVLYVTGFLLFLAFLLFAQRTIAKSGILNEEPYSRYSQGWVLQNSGEPVALPTRGNGEADVTYTIENDIPNRLPENAYLIFRSQQQTVSVYVEDTKIYQYPEEPLYAGVTPSAWNMVKLPGDAEEKQIRIEQCSPYKQFAGKISEVYYGSYYELLYLLQHRYSITFIISISIGIIGMLMFLAAVLFRRGNHYRSEEILGILLIDVSAYLTGESKMFLPGTNAEVQYYATFTAFILIPIFLAAYLNSKMEGGFRNKIKQLLIGSIAVGVICLGLQITGIKSFIETIPLVLIMIGLVFSYGVISYRIHIYRKENGFSKTEYYSMILIFIAIIAEVICFYLNMYRTIGIFVRISLLYYTLCVLYLCIRKIYQTLKENEQLTEQLRESNTALMISQIQPHFIYNTLNSIRALIRISPEDAYRMVYDFSTYLRANIDSISKQREILFSEELKHIRAYVNIEKTRFQERLHVEYEISTDAFYLPPLSVQPLVENAIKHGVCKKTTGGTVWVKSYETESHYIIEVKDDGVGFDTGILQETGAENKSAGIQNIRFRIDKISNAVLEIESEIGIGTKATIKFSKK